MRSDEFNYDDLVVTARERILVPALSDWEELADVDWCIRKDNPGAPLAEIQHKTIEMIRSLVGEGLCELGTVEAEGFVPVGDLERGISDLSKLYIDNHDDPGWRYAYWLNLTDAGETLARSIYDANPAAFTEDEDE